MFDAINQALARGELNQALVLAENLARREPDNADVLLALALVQRSLGRLDDATASLDRALELAGERPGLYMSRAMLRAGRGDGRGARADLAMSVALDPNYLGAYLMLAEMALSDGDLAEAERQLALAQRVDPDAPQVLGLEGNIAARKGDADLAERLLSRALSLRPDDPALLSSVGMLHLQRNYNAFAAQAFGRALAARPDLDDIRRARIEALRRDRRDDEVIAELAELVRRAPTDLGAVTALADGLVRQGRLEEAHPHLRTLFASDSPSNPVAADLARLLVGQGAAALARTLVEEQLQQAPSPRWWSVRLGLAGQDTADAEAVIARWLEQDPHSLVARDALMQLHEGAGRRDEAGALADALLDADADHVNALLTKVRLALHGDAAAALPWIERLRGRELDPGARGALDHWHGRVLDAVGQPQAAARVWLDAAQAEAQAQGGGMPALTPAQGATPAADAEAPVLLWGAPGSRPEWLVQLLQQQGQRVVLGDRFSPLMRVDGFNLADGAARGDASRDTWRAGLASLGLAPGQAVDWMPSLDGRQVQQLAGVRLLVPDLDPRDMLLNWLVHGCAQGWAFPGPDAAAEWLEQALQVVEARLADDPASVLRVPLARLEADAAGVAAELEAFLGLESGAITPRPAPHAGVGGHPIRFHDGRWQDFDHGPLAAAFARLEPLARRLDR